MQNCKIKNCGEKHKAKGYCHKHYTQIKRKMLKMTNPKGLKEYDKKYNSKYRMAHSEELKEKKRKYERTKRMEFRDSIFRELGLKCSKCGFDDIRALQIDHIFNDGCARRKSIKGSRIYYRKILIEILSGSKDYQILCANCNWIKYVEKKKGDEVLSQA